MNLYDLAIAKKLAGGGGGGGSSNIVTGTFKRTENGAFQLPISYEGAGYPVRIFITVKGGIDCPNTDFYDLVSSGAFAMYSAQKSNPSVSPDYSSSDIKNQLDFVYLRKSSTSNAHSFNAQNSIQNTLYKETATPSTSNWVVIKSNTNIQVWVADSNFGFRPNIEYHYTIEYSS